MGPGFQNIDAGASEMAAIDWDKQLEVGIATIDKQHRRWVELYNALDIAVQEGRQESKLGETLEALIEYSQYHFGTEEVLMRQNEYDAEEFSLHCREHRVFTDQIVIYKDRHDAGFQRLTPVVMASLRDWLVTHITASDRGYISTLKGAGVE
jgi:hemerythrin-like metal-binding protein